MHHEYSDNDNVKFIIAFADPGQPYSCNQWGNIPDLGSPQIILDEVGTTMYQLFHSSAYPSTVYITHDMKVYDLMNLPGTWSVNNRIASMLEDCGNNCDDTSQACSNVIDGDVNNDQITNISDILILSNSILNDIELECLPDVNQDGFVDVSDIVTIINIILS